jgi:hypothetical protein
MRSHHRVQTSEREVTVMTSSFAACRFPKGFTLLIFKDGEVVKKIHPLTNEDLAGLPLPERLMT